MLDSYVTVVIFSMLPSLSLSITKEADATTFEFETRNKIMHEPNGHRYMCSEIQYISNLFLKALTLNIINADSQRRYGKRKNTQMGSEDRKKG